MHTFPSFIIRHRPRFRRACTLAAAGVPLAFAAAAVLVDGWPARRFLLLYMAPFFPAFFAWARLRVDAMERQPPAALGVDAVAAVLAAARMTGDWLPFSGHMLFYTYAALATRSLAFHALVAVLAAAAAWFKLVLWGDARSFALGIAAGLVLAAVRAMAARRAAPDSASAT